jgi:hypothetical protein
VIFLAQQLEKRYVNDYFANELVDKHVQLRAPLGVSRVPMVSKELNVIARWVDAIVFESTVITLFEFKLEPTGEAVGQLDLYEQMFKTTPWFSRYWDRAIKKVLVTTRIDDNVQALCDAHGIEYRVFHPDWISYWEKRRFRV